MSFSDLEDPEPKKADANAGNADDRAGEEEEDQEEKDDIVDREDLGRLDEDPVHRIQDVRVSKHVSAMAFAD